MLMRLISRYWLLVPLLLLAIVIRDWVETTPETVEIEETIDMRATESDYYLEQFKTSKFDADGELEYEITGKTLAHYPIDDRSEVTEPSLVMHRSHRNCVRNVEFALNWLAVLSRRRQAEPAFFSHRAL